LQKIKPLIEGNPKSLDKFANILKRTMHEELEPQKKFAPGDYSEVINSVNYFAQLAELNDICRQHQSTLYNLNELNKC